MNDKLVYFIEKTVKRILGWMDSTEWFIVHFGTIMKKVGIVAGIGVAVGIFLSIVFAGTTFLILPQQGFGWFENPVKFVSAIFIIIPCDIAFINLTWEIIKDVLGGIMFSTALYKKAKKQQEEKTV